MITFYVDSFHFFLESSYNDEAFMIKRWFSQWIGTKKFYQEMFAAALPIAFQQLISALVNLLDSAMIGRYGNDLLGAGGSEITSAAIMIAGRYGTTMDNIIVMLAISCTIFIAQFFGAKDFLSTKKIFGLSLKLTLGMGVIATFVGVAFPEMIINFFATGYNDGSLMTTFGTEYLSIFAWTFIPYSISVAFSFSLRAIKNSNTPLIASGLAAFTNLGLNYLFIYVFQWGIAGAAFATILARFVELGILIHHYFQSKPAFFGTFQELFSIGQGFSRKVMKKNYPIALAAIITEVLAIFMMFAYAQIDQGNAVNIAAITISQRVVDLILAFVGGMGTAAMVMVGTRLGAGNIDEARTHARWQIAYVILLSFGTIFIMIGSIPLIQWVFGFGESGNGLLSIVMIIHALSLPFFFFSSNVIFVTRAGGYTRSPMLITNVPYFFIKIPLVAYFVFIAPNQFSEWVWLNQLFQGLGLPFNLLVFIFVLDRLIELVRAGIAWIIYRYGRWYQTLSTTHASPNHPESIRSKIELTKPKA
jgi:putative MATE family efflux protein